MAKERDFVLLRKVTLTCLGIAVVGAVTGHFVAPRLIPMIFGSDWHAALPVLDVFLIAIVVHVLAMMFGYPLAAGLDRVAVANSSVVYGSLAYVALAGGLLVSRTVNPTSLAWLLAISETYVLLHCALLLWPAARRQYWRRLAEQQGT